MIFVSSGFAFFKLLMDLRSNISIDNFRYLGGKDG